MTMKSWCLNCNREEVVTIDTETNTSNIDEKKLEGYCNKCNEYICLITVGA